MSDTLTTALQPIVSSLVEDMRDRLHDDAERLAQWQAEHKETVKANRTAGSFSEWEEEQLQQAAVSWILTTVFIRFIEDNGLFGETWAMISGHTDALRSRARDNEQEFYAKNPELSYRGYLQHCFEQLKDVPATEGLVDDHAAFRIIEPSDRGARQIIDFWREVDEEGQVTWSLHDESLSTRFLGDMYQDLSAYARERYALLQTPVFVEEFILERTLLPALEERPLEGFKLIDPTCGSGHFLLGAYEILLDRWQRYAPALEPRELANEAMKAIHGVDINPSAVAITKFRLVVAFMRAAEDRKLNNQLPEPEFTVLADDTLYWGPGSAAAGKDALPMQITEHGLQTEEPGLLSETLAPGRYDVVVGNPPYITVKDKALNAFYRERYAPYCKGKYAMTVPSMVAFFALAKQQKADQHAGWVGQITGNAFMQRQFGKPLIEKFFKKVDLREVIDTSGAYVPGHGTPTVIIVGRNATPTRRRVLGVLGIQGEPGVPSDPANGKVWRSIVDHVDNIGFENEYVSVAELTRGFIGSFPWNLQGGAAPEISAMIETGKPLERICESIGFGVITGDDDAFVLPKDAVERFELEKVAKSFSEGLVIRDFRNRSQLETLDCLDFESISGSLEQFFWPNRVKLEQGLVFGESKKVRGIPYFHFTLPNKTRLHAHHLIAFAFVATHNHFVLDRGGKVFNRSAPVIKLADDATEDDHLSLLGLLNSSTACFWLKQNSHDKGNGGYGGGIASDSWERFYEFTGTTLKNFPLPDGHVTERGRRLDTLAQELSEWDPVNLFEDATPSRELIEEAQHEYTRIRQLMIAEQEELDWAVYYLYGLTNKDLSLPVGEVDGVALGERPFELALARRGTETAWFERHHSTPTTDIPDGLSDEYRAAVEKRLELIESDRKIKLLEAPEYKRRWSDDLWEDKVRDALEAWLLGRLETRSLWFNEDGRMPRPRTIRELAGVIETESDYADVLEVLPLWSTRTGRSTLDMLTELLKNQPVPYHKALRYRKAGLRKRAEWEATWEAQRREDAGEITAEEVPVPPNYRSADMYPAVWKHRGKLDVPKERFISYPGTVSDDDTSALLGWAGWNHLEQGLALMGIFHQRQDADAEITELAALLSGLTEQLPWIMQWHNDADPDLGIRFGDYLTQQLHGLSQEIGVPVEDLDKYAPVTGRKTRKKKG